ncbi:GNAT family N-acetyltransferase [Streptomyces sp. NBC_01142]|uniref:GNAT family N-acetyltransferase n=1 Tax=Streptomyces sp. NBC_01142 TaxID=2975865 RepID=UPI00224F3689|nr:GNAT family N-acetyltransferase [Streptomyces sp. NBC_01142]MCX4819571.1 GNAT family N-acetyltransferase [Streptomyces sp. NBC_01142]
MTVLPRTAHTFELSPAELLEIRTLLTGAFDGDFGDDDWDHTLGGVHALLYEDGVLVAHGSVVQRRVIHAGRSLRIGYIEAVAVRADRRRRGLGDRVMDALERVIDGAYELGALSASDEGAELYRSRGWQLWGGRVEALGPEGAVHLPEEEDSTFLRPAGGRPLPETASALLFDWRDGDVL